MKYEDTDALELQREVERDFSRPGAFVVVSSDCVDRRQLAQLFEYFGPADISGMNDVAGARERTDRFRTKQPMRIRYESYRFQRPKSPVSSPLLPCTNQCPPWRQVCRDCRELRKQRAIAARLEIHACGGNCGTVGIELLRIGSKRWSIDRRAVWGGCHGCW